MPLVQAQDTRRWRFDPHDEAMLAGDEARPPARPCASSAPWRASRARRAHRRQPGHIDGCIYASPANLTFAEAMAALGARVRIPTTMNAISVDRENWRGQGVPPDFGEPAAAPCRCLCANGLPRQLHLRALSPGRRAGSAARCIGWSESNAVIYRQFRAGRAHGQAPGFPRPVHRADRPRAAVGRLSRRGAPGPRRSSTSTCRRAPTTPSGRWSAMSPGTLARQHPAAARARRRQAVARRSQGALRRLRHHFRRADAAYRGRDARGSACPRAGRGPVDSRPRPISPSVGDAERRARGGGPRRHRQPACLAPGMPGPRCGALDGAMPATGPRSSSPRAGK